jgi:hypothetical protein
MKRTVQVDGGMVLVVQVDEDMSLKLARNNGVVYEDDRVALCIAQVVSSMIDV